METIAATFTDHLAVCLRLTVDVPIVRLGRGFWKMDALLDDITITEQMRSIWIQLKQQKDSSPVPRWGGGGMLQKENHMFLTTRTS